MKRIDRRGFLRTGITGAAGMMALSPAMIKATESSQERNIIYRTLGKTGLKIPVISFGVMRADNANLCKAAYEKGITLFDTANGYQNGNNEIMLGNLFKDYPRKSFILATKVKPDRDRDGKPNAQTSPEAFLTKFNESLSRLKMDYVDILYVHDISTPELLEYKPIINTVKKLKKDGCKVILISASSEFYLQEFYNIKEVDKIIGTRYEFGNKTARGRIIGLNCKGEEKVIRLKEFIEEEGLEVDFKESFMFSDSLSDSPLFNLVGHPYLINYSGKSQKFEVLKWK